MAVSFFESAKEALEKVKSLFCFKYAVPTALSNTIASNLLLLRDKMTSGTRVNDCTSAS